jgi:hypothetical protein
LGRLGRGSSSEASSELRPKGF